MPGYFLLGLALSLTTTLPLAWNWVLGVRRTAVAVAALSLSTGILIEVPGVAHAHCSGPDGGDERLGQRHATQLEGGAEVGRLGGVGLEIDKHAPGAFGPFLHR